jgi:hypothetical protein
MRRTTMKLIDPQGLHPAFDVPAGLAAALKAQGYKEVVEPVKAETLVTVSWSVQRGRFIGDYECPPLITYSASNGNKGYCESQVGTAHKTVKVRAGGRWHYCPSHVAEEYERLFAEWAAKSKKRTPVEQVSAQTPKHILQAQASTLIGTGAWRRDVETRER